MALRKPVFKEAARKMFARRRVLRNKGFARKTPKVKPDETGMMIEEENAILDRLTEIYPTWASLWPLLNELCCKQTTYWIVSRPSRQRMLAVMIRLKKEGRVVYTKNGGTVYYCSLSPSEARVRHCSTGT